MAGDGGGNNMHFEYADGNHQDFVQLCYELDLFLNKVAGGEEHRGEYIPYNQLGDIHNVVIAYDKNIPIGCGSFKRYNDTCAEVKRVFISEAYQQQGISRIIMQLLEDQAKNLGFSYFILESGEPLVAAMHLYERLGFQVTTNYGVYVGMTESICMKKVLT